MRMSLHSDHCLSVIGSPQNGLPDEFGCEIAYDTSGPTLNPIAIYDNAMHAAYNLAEIDQRKIWDTDGYTLAAYDLEIVFGPVPNSPPSQQRLLQTRYIMWGLMCLGSFFERDKIWKPAITNVYWERELMGAIAVQKVGTGANLGISNTSSPLLQLNTSALQSSSDYSTQALRAYRTKCEFDPSGGPMHSLSAFLLALNVYARIAQEGIEKPETQYNMKYGNDGSSNHVTLEATAEVVPGGRTAMRLQGF